MFTIPCTVVCASTLLCVHACGHAVCVCVCTKLSICCLRGWLYVGCLGSCVCVGGGRVL